MTAAAISNARLGDLVVVDGIGRGDILGPDQADDLQLPDLEVDPDLLASGDHQVAVGQYLGDEGGDAQIDLLVAVDAARALGHRIAIQVDQARWIDCLGQDLRQAGLVTEDGARRGVLAGRAAARRGVVDRRLVLDLDDHGQDIADLGRALVLEEVARARPP